MRARRSVAAAVVCALAATLIVHAGPAHAESCGTGGHAAGEWTSYGRDLSNGRHQELETTIDASNAADLEAAWGVSALDAGAVGAMQGTPIIADGCLFFGTSAGAVVAADAETGEVVWQTSLASFPAAAGIFTPAVSDGRVHVLVGQMFLPYAAALDQATGEVLWTTPLVDEHIGFVNASAVVWDGLVFAATAGRDLLDPFSRPPFFILDAETGEILKKTRVIPDDQAVEGTSPYGGGGIWTTAVIDTETKLLYAGTANPYSKKLEHERTNSILQIDFDRASPTFGEIVGNYKGDFDYIPERYDSVECQTLGDAQPVGYSVFCGQQDVDFGASPNLMTTSDGRTAVGAFQKSGTYHLVDTETMTKIWSTNFAEPSAGGNSATSAYDEDGIYVVSNAGLHALDRETGEIKWHRSELTSGYRPVSVANGLVYAFAPSGELNVLRTTDGEVVAELPLAAGGVTCDGGQVGSVAIARNTVFAGCDDSSAGTGAVFAFRL